MLKAIVAATCVAATPCSAADLTNRQCLEVLAGLNSLNFVGQLNPNQQPGSDAKQYKLGPLRLTIALDIAEIAKVQEGLRRAQQDFEKEVGPMPDSKDPDGGPKSIERQKKINDNLDALMAKPCMVQPGHIKAADLKLGDGPDENAIPPGVLSTLTAIIDR